MEFAKFMYKFSNQMLPEHFCDYFTQLNNVHQYNTTQKHTNEFYQFYISTELGKKTLHDICLNIWKNIPQKFRHGSFLKFKQYYKSVNALLKYN